MASVAVIGLGGVGGPVAAFLTAAAHHHIVGCTRRPLSRVRVDHTAGALDVEVTTLTDAHEASTVDWVLLCTKAHDTASAAPWLARLCGERTRVAVLQNGIGHAERLAPLIGGATVVPTVVYFNGEQLGDGHVRFGHAGDCDLAVPADPHGTAFASLFMATPLRVQAREDFELRAWRKLLLNAVANPVTALTMQRLAVLRRDDVRSLALALLDEGVAVAQAAGVPLAASEASAILDTLLAYPPDASTSMYFDRVAGRPLEVDALSGAIVDLAARYGVPTPLHAAMATLLRASSAHAGDGQR